MTKIEVTSYSDELAEAVKSVSDAMKGMQASGVSDRLIITLIKDYNPRLKKTDIETVLVTMRDLARYYLEKTK